MLKLSVLAMLFLFSVPGWAQVGCEISNTGADTGIATISATTGKGYSAPGGVGAVGFRIPVSCKATNVAYHVWQVDTSTSTSPTTYDIGLYCVSGDCATGGHGGALYLHTGPNFGSWFTNNRLVATYSGVTVTAIDGTHIKLTGTFLLSDFPIGLKLTISNCTAPFNGTAVVTSATTSLVMATETNSGTSHTPCTVKTAATYPPGFPSSTVCTNNSMADPCQEALRWVADGRTVCSAIPCTLPAGMYAAAIGTTCTDAPPPATCAQLLGDADQGLIYPFTASGSGYDSGGLAATMSFTVNSTTAVWNTTQGASAPIKPVKLLIY